MTPVVLPTSSRARLGLIGVLAFALLGAIMAWGAFARRVDALRSHRAAGPAWSFPSRVYSDAVVFIAGRALPHDYLTAHLAARDYRPAEAPLTRPGSYARVSGGVEVFVRGFRDGPSPFGQGGPERVRLQIDNAVVQSVERLGGAEGAGPPDLAHPPGLEPVLVSMLFAGDPVRSTWIPFARIPQIVRDAVVVAEDRRFYRHVGLDLRGNLRAMAANLRSGGVRQGGSTITQQLARGLILGRERTLGRKLGEAVVALGLEVLLDKDEILEMYLNSVYWGQSQTGGLAGIQEAARYYFGTPVESLATEQAALLAAMIPAPNLYSPIRRPRAALQRRNAVLDALVAEGRLDRRAALRARAKRLGIRPTPGAHERFPSFGGYVREALERSFPGESAQEWGLAIYSSLDLVWQEQATASLAAELSALERWSGRQREPLQGAFVVLDPATGNVRAMVGGRGLRPGDFNRATQAVRQTGSAIKPIVYATALERPEYTAASTVPDLRRTFRDRDSTWSPRNDQDDYHETVTLAKALAKSQNVATANLVEAVGPATVSETAERFGLGRLPPVPSIGLGTGEVSLLSLTTAYAVFASGGVRHRPTPFRAILDIEGRRLDPPPSPPARVLRPEIAALMTGLLEDVVIYGVAYPLRTIHAFGRPVAGKTGTTNDYKDAWFVGFTRDAVAGVWVGFDAPQSLARPAAETALPVWAAIMKRLLAGIPVRSFDERTLTFAVIDPWTGLLAGGGCRPMRVPFLPGTAPREVCRQHPAVIGPPEWLFGPDSAQVGDEPGRGEAEPE
ncbi:MAG TPA: transglycosylase domain-containing protein [Candidatus Limnocylindria bacterium]|nr:transglycosylase domain-containing protein [Candidatus Limnocylindria bacterium]